MNNIYRSERRAALCNLLGVTLLVAAGCEAEPEHDRVLDGPSIELDERASDDLTVTICGEDVDGAVAVYVEVTELESDAALDRVAVEVQMTTGISIHSTYIWAVIAEAPPPVNNWFTIEEEACMTLSWTFRLIDRSVPLTLAMDTSLRIDFARGDGPVEISIEP